MKKRIISGLTATNQLTLGNYIGAIKPLLKYQKESEIFLFVADLHAVSQNVDSHKLHENVENLLLIYLSSGFDIETSKIFIQSEIVGHSELAFLLTSVTYLGELNRMTQFKDKAEGKEKNGTINIPSSLLFYPILMAADILIYNPDEVIVGEDQRQHLELTNTIIKRLNKKFNLNFNIPIPNIDKSVSKIMSLKNPNKKMSKSDIDPFATIFLLDDKETIHKKIMSSVTDSEAKIYYDLEKKPGISNLLTIYKSLKDITIKEAEKKFKNSTYKNFKEEVSQAVIDELTIIQNKYNVLKNGKIKEISDKNRKVVQEIALENLNIIKKSMGLI